MIPMRYGVRTSFFAFLFFLFLLELDVTLFCIERRDALVVSIMSVVFRG